MKKSGLVTMRAVSPTLIKSALAALASISAVKRGNISSDWMRSAVTVISG